MEMPSLTRQVRTTTYVIQDWKGRDHESKIHSLNKQIHYLQSVFWRLTLRSTRKRLSPSSNGSEDGRRRNRRKLQRERPSQNPKGGLLTQRQRLKLRVKRIMERLLSWIMIMIIGRTLKRPEVVLLLVGHSHSLN